MVKLPLLKKLITGIKYNFILVIIKRLTKYAYMLPFKELATAKKLAHVFLKTIVASYSTPNEIILNKNKLFILKF